MMIALIMNIMTGRAIAILGMLICCSRSGQAGHDV
jgi:hypothetical protein